MLADPPTRDARDHALWIQARAAWSLGTREAAEALCLALVTSEPSPYGARALAEVARWRWNDDDDAGALRLFRDVARRFPGTREAPEALYAIGPHPAGVPARYDEAFRSYTALAERYPTSKRTAAEARWRAGWVRYLAGDYAGAAESFARLAAGERARDPRRRRVLGGACARAGRAPPTPRPSSTHVAEEHPATLLRRARQRPAGHSAARRRGRRLGRASAPAFPDELTGAARRARPAATPSSASTGWRAASSMPSRRSALDRALLLQAYAAVEAPGPALRLARTAVGTSRPRYLYPLGYWEVVRPMAESRGLDPLLVAALIRQESLFFPDAVSPADAHGLMQLLPAHRARAGRRPPDVPSPTARRCTR